MDSFRRLMIGILLALLTWPLIERAMAGQQPPDPAFQRDRLVAWCIVPFDNRKRSPAERAEMLNRLGMRRLAYDYRQEHMDSFDEELEQLKKHHIELTAWWFPGSLNDEAKLILATLKRHGVRTQLWVTGEGAPTHNEEEQAARVKAEVDRLRPIAMAAADQGCSVGLYNHGGWFGEPANQVAIIKALGMPNVGIVYNLHHAHSQLDRLTENLELMKPYLMVLNWNGSIAQGDTRGKKIVPIGAGELDGQVLEIIRRSGFHGSFGILNHTQFDAEQRLLDNLEGLEWIQRRLRGESAEPPKYRTWEEPAVFVAPEVVEPLTATEEKRLRTLVSNAQEFGQASKGAQVFAQAKSACLSCHRIGEHGGKVGPDLSLIGTQRTIAQLAESLIWPNRHVELPYRPSQFITTDGQLIRGYVISESNEAVVVRDPTQGTELIVELADVESRKAALSFMPEGLIDSMSSSQQADLLAFLVDLGRHEKFRKELAASVLKNAQSHDPSPFLFDRKPLNPIDWPSWEAFINRDRVYDFYTKQALYFKALDDPPNLLSEFPELDGGKYGHWGNQNEQTWANNDWNQTDLGTVLSGVFHGANGQVVTRGICVRLGEDQSLSACYNSDSLEIEALWEGGFLEFSSVRHGFLDGLLQKGKEIEVPAELRLAKADRKYLGLYRIGKRTVFAFRENGVVYLDAPWVERGKLVREVAPMDRHSLRDRLAKTKPQWPQVIETAIRLGTREPYAIDTFELPVENPWKALLYCGDHDLLPDGSAMVCTMQGDVWHVTGIAVDDPSYPNPKGTAKWRRFASGLHQPLGLKVSEDGIFVMGRDQLTRLHDLNHDGEADYYECYAKGFQTSASGHDYICGLQRDAQGNFYTASSNQGLVRISADGQQAVSLAEGFRNPDGIGIYPDGVVTIPCSEGDWTPASMICAVNTRDAKNGQELVPRESIPFFGHRSARFSKRPIEQPSLPMVYLPRGVDNSAGGQVFVDSHRWGPLMGQLIHFSFGTASHLLVLRDEVDGQYQGAVVPLVGEFLSGAHRGRFSAKDGQLYVSGMGGWGNYSPDLGCFHRVRYTGKPVQLPVGIKAHRNGIAIRFSLPLDPATATRPRSHFAQAWNYRYSAAYGSAEYSSLHYGSRGHDRLDIRSSHVLDDGKTLFLEIPELQPVEQLHLHVGTDPSNAIDLFATCHRLADDRRDFPGYRPLDKVLAAHPIEYDMKMVVQRVPNPWSRQLDGAIEVRMRAGKNLSYETRRFTVRAGEPVHLQFLNPDAVPHNWALIKPGTLQQVGEQANRLVGDPEAFVRQYVPQTDDVLCYTDVVDPGQETSIYFHAPKEPGVYPFLCTFPGHWMVMNGQLVVEP